MKKKSLSKILNHPKLKNKKQNKLAIKIITIKYGIKIK